MSYKTQILNHLMTGATLEPMTALRLWGCWSLSQRISELRQVGYPIQSKMTTAPSGKRYAVYWLDKSHIEWAKNRLSQSK